MFRGFQVVCLLFFLAALSYSQAIPAGTSVTFTLDFPESQPGHYSLLVQSDGKAHYESSGKVSSQSDDVDSYAYDFTMSPATRDKIFDLAAKAGYFQKDLDSHRKNMAFTGRKTLAYKDGQRSSESTFNYTPSATAAELTNLFQGLSDTLELGHRLEYSLRYQKLALAEELKHTEDRGRLNPPVEIQAIAPILQQIVADASVMNVTRARAQRLLETPAGH